MNTLQLLLIEKAKRQAIIDALLQGYQQVALTSPACQCARAAGVYRFLADKLGVSHPNNEWKMQIRDLLSKQAIIAPVIYQGIIFWKGLVAKDNAADLAKAEHLRQYRHHYRANNKENKGVRS